MSYQRDPRERVSSAALIVALCVGSAAALAGLLLVGATYLFIAAAGVATPRSQGL